MKKALVVVLVLFSVFTFCSCEMKTAENNGTTDSDNVNIQVEQGCSLYDYVHLSGQEFDYDVYEIRSEKEYAHRKYEKYYWIVDVFKDGNKIAEIRHDKPEYVEYMYPKAQDIVGEIDINFDGRNDIIIDHGYVDAPMYMDKSYYTCYLQTDDGFEKLEGFENISNVCLDCQNKIYLSTSGSPYVWEIEASYKEENGKIVFIESSQELAESYEWLNGDDAWGQTVVKSMYYGMDATWEDSNRNGIPDESEESDVSLPEEEKLNETLEWTIDENGTLTVKGKGRMTHTPWLSKRALIKNVVIKEGITTVAERAFEYCRNLKTVKLAKSVYEIGSCAFKDCTSLENVTATEKLRLISRDTFEGSLWLSKQLDGVVYFNNIAYGYKKDGIILEDSDEMIESLYLKEGTVGIAKGAFYGVEFDAVYMPNSVEFVCSSAFYSLRHTAEDGIVYIGKTAYDNVGNAKASHYNVEFKPGTKYISSYMFCEGPLHHIDKIVIPESVEIIESMAFNSDLLIAEIIYEGSKKQWKDVIVGEYNDALTNADIRFMK